MIIKKLCSVLIIVFMCSVSFAAEETIGTTFSPVQCEYLGLNWRETYKSILDMPFDIIRLGAYWDRIEKEPDQFDFSELDWQIEQARAKRIPVVLTVGMKAPRWPEYFIPDWVLERADLSFGADVSKSDYLRERTLIFIKTVVERYKEEEIIQCWQVENEAMDRIGAEYWYIGPDFLKTEVELVKKLDNKKRKIILTAATYPNKVLRFISGLFSAHDPIKESLRICDILGINIYPIVGQKFFGKDFYFRTKPEERNRYFSDLFNVAEEKGKKIWVMELQSEPWEPGHLVYKQKKVPSTAMSKDLVVSYGEMEGLGIRTIFLWGVEYWLFRLHKYGDEAYLKKFEKII